VSRKPSKQLVTSTGVGAGVGSLIEIGAAAFGVPLPPGTGAALAAAITAGVHYLQKRGRAPATTPPEIP
jgi:hypothetical protein